MIHMQKYIELGTGYAEIFELEQLICYNKPRIDKAIMLKHGDDQATFLLVMNPVKDHFQAIYSIFKGIPVRPDGPQKKYELIRHWLDEASIQLIEIDTKHPDEFFDKELYYQYVTGILRLNYLLPNMK